MKIPKWYPCTSQMEIVCFSFEYQTWPSQWTLGEAENFLDYQDANEAVPARYPCMFHAHAITNACLMILGMFMSVSDFSKIIGQTVAMGFDNDCIAATTGSITGAVLGKQHIPEHWWKNFNNKVISFLNDHPQFAIDDLIERFIYQANCVFNREVT